MIQRVPCKTCGDSIHSDIAAKNDGLCMPCKGGYKQQIEEGKKRREQERQYEQSPERLYWLDYLRENFYVTTSGTFRTQALQHNMSEMGVDRVLFSVDYPYESMHEISDWFDNCSISPNDKRKVASENARRILGLSTTESAGAQRGRPVNPGG